MKLTGTACAEALSGAEDAGTRERAKRNAGGVRVEQRVRRWDECSISDFCKEGVAKINPEGWV